MYEIIITKKVIVKCTQVGEAVLVGKQRVEIPNWIGNEKDVWERLPDREYSSEEEREIYKQEVEDLNLIAVINAINGGTDDATKRPAG